MTPRVSRKEFIDWLKTKPANKPACLDDINNCVMAEYAKEKFGAVQPEAGTQSVFNWHSAEHVFDFDFHTNYSEFEGAKTYGEVIKKLEG